MPNQRISDLPAASPLTGTELAEVVQSGTNKKTTTQDIANLNAGGGGSASDWGDLGGTLSDQTDLQSALDLKSNSLATIVTGGTNYTLQSSDLTLVNAGANIIIEGSGGTLTIPTNATVAFPSNCFIGFRGFILVAAAGGVTAMPTNASLDCDPDFLFTLEKTSINGWNVHNGSESTGGGGGGSGTVNSGAQYRLAHYATAGTVLSNASAITAARALKSDANGVPTHFDTATEPSLTELAYVKGLTSAAQTQLDAKVDEETFATLTDGSSVTWNTNSRQNPLAKLTSTQSFTIDMTNVKSGSQGTLKLIKNTASDVVMTFDTSFTNKQLNAGLATYTFSGASGNEYFLTYCAEGTNLEWVIGDVVNQAPSIQVAKVSRVTTQTLSNNTYTAITWTTEVVDTGALVNLGTDATKLTVSGTGDKWVTVNAQIVYTANATGIRRIRIYVNGADTASEYFESVSNAGASATTIVRGTFKIYCQGGDYVQVMGYQNSGGNLDITTAFTHFEVFDL